MPPVRPDESAYARYRMVERQLRARDIHDERVLEAMASVPRELFVPEELRDRAYDDSALPLPEGQTISQPYMVARIAEALELHGREHVLDVGTGSGYQAAVLAELAAEVALFREGEAAVARRDGEELVFAPSDGGWSTQGDESILDHPDALARAYAALANPNAGEVIVSAAPGFEFADLGGRHHAGGGSHGSLEAGDSVVPMLVVGLERLPRSIVDVAPAVLEHFGLRPPQYARAA